MRKILIPLTLCFVGLYAHSQPATLKYLPENANMVVRVSLARLGAKITAPVLRESAPVKDLLKDSADTPAKTLFNNPAQTGIDFGTDLYLTFQKDSAAPAEKPEIHLYGHLTDQALFTKFIKSFFPKDSLYTYGSNRIIYKDDMTFCWNNEIFTISPVKKNRANTGEHADTTKIVTEKEMLKVMDRLIKEKREQSFALLTPHAGNAYVTDALFSEAIRTPSDIMFWMTGDTNPAAKWLKQFPQMMKMPALNRKRAAYLDFETGAINMRIKNYLNDSIAQIYAKYTPAKQNMELINKLDQEGLILLVNFTTNIEMAQELFARSGMEEKLKEFKSQLPFDPMQFKGAFKPDLLLAVFKKASSTSSDSSKNFLKGFEALVVIPIDNIEKFEQIKKTALQAWDSLQNKSMGKKLGGFKPSVKNNQQYCVVSISPEAAEHYMAKAPDSAGWEWTQAYKQYPILINFKIGELLAAIKSMRPEKSKPAKEQPLAKLFDQLIISGGIFEQGSVNTIMELKTTEPTENTLQLLFKKLLAPKEKK